MIFYHVPADIQRPLMDDPWLGVKGCTKPTGQGWKLHLLQKDVMRINAFPLLCSETVTVPLQVAAPNTLGWPNYGRLTQSCLFQKPAIIHESLVFKSFDSIQIPAKNNRKESFQLHTVLP